MIFCATLAVTRAKIEETKTREGKVKEETIPSKHNGKQSYHISSNKSLSQKQNNSNNILQQQRTSNTTDTNFGNPPEENSITGNRRDCELSGTKWIHRNIFDTISLNIKKNCHYNLIINSS